ncbi:hypothetical protein PAXINDRAFT_15194 [Paxillus involutus ATCC 200175]|uniref:Uncharacterized protein n=1 Tax=Paxillus involutus ATCC 200175 TaxID=664439 RepID=A0A0C9TWE3_PAXIN|nr:hypothetical protein PAXINDRAFT_15194 [Paxillus involutus ATCC 200175]
MKLVLNQHLVGDYLAGTIRAPDPLTEPGAFNNWTLNNITIVSILCLCVSHEDRHLLEDVTNAKEAWNTLRERHKKVGPIAQILLIQEVFAKCYSQGQHFSLASSELSELVCRIYRIGIPTEEVFLSIAMLNALSASTTHTKHGNYSHGNEKAGGGMAGRRDEVLARIRAEKLSRQNKANSQPSSGTSTLKSASTASSVPHSICYDNSGHTYIIDSVTSGAIFLVSAPPMPMPVASPAVTSEGPIRV